MPSTKLLCDRLPVNIPSGARGDGERAEQRTCRGAGPGAGPNTLRGMRLLDRGGGYLFRELLLSDGLLPRGFPGFLMCRNDLFTSLEDLQKQKAAFAGMFVGLYRARRRNFW